MDATHRDGTTVASVFRALAVLLALVLIGGEAVAADATPPAPVRDVDGTGEWARAHLYFSDRKNQYLTAEVRTLDGAADAPSAYAGDIVRALIAGPEEGLMRTLPAATRLLALFILADGTAYVDLSVEAAEDHPGGVRMERLSIYSVVNSLVLNVSEIKRVKILINGGEAETLAGHVDLRFPLRAEMLLIR